MKTAIVCTVLIFISFPTLAIASAGPKSIFHRRPEVSPLDDQVDVATPDLGATLNAIIAKMPRIGTFASGKIAIPCGAYALSTPVVIQSYAVSIEGSSSACVLITSSAPTAFRISTHPFNVTNAGQISGFTLIGNGSEHQVGIHFGDIIALRFFDLKIKGFTGAGSIAMWADDAARWTERTEFDKVHLEANATNLAFTDDGGTGSFGYTRFVSLFMNTNAGQTGISLANDSVLYNSLFVVQDNVDGAGTVLSMSGTSQIASADFDFVTEETSGSGGIFLSTAPGTRLSGAGVLIGQKLTSITRGSVEISASIYGPGNSLNQFPSVYSTTPDATVIAQTGAAGNYLFGHGNNLYFDGVNYRTHGDTVSNGAQAILGTHASPQQLGFYVIPDTGGSGQTIPPSQLSTYLKATLNSNGDWVPYGHLDQSAPGQFAGKCTMTASNTCTIAIAAGFKTSPICIVTLQGTGPVIAGECSFRDTTLTITAASPNSGTWAAELIGNPN